MKRSGSFCLFIIWAYHLTAQVSITTADAPYSQDFNTLATSGTSTTLPTGWALLETGAGSNTSYSAGSGSSATADTYSFGTGTNSDRALGEVTGTPSTTFGASFVNNTGVSITSILIQYIGEQWRLGATGHVDQLDFEYSTNATSLSTGTWTAVNNLDFVAPITTGTIGALDGNANANRTSKGNIISSLSIANGATFWIRWVALDATSADDGLSVDDFVIAANPITHYNISNTAGVLSITDAAGKSELLTLSEVGTNIRFFAKGRTYSLNNGTATPLPYDVSLASLNSMIVNTANGNDSITVNAFATSIPDLTLSGGQGDDVITFNGDLTFGNNESLDVDLQNDDATPGTDQIIFASGSDADIAIAGTGTAVLKASQFITINSGCSLSTINGNMTIEANQQVTPSSGNFIGLNVTGGTLQVTGSGILTAKGKGGNTGTNQHGISVNALGDIIGGTTGTTIIEGRCGASSGNIHSGVLVTGSGASISTNGTHLSVTGFGSTLGSSNFGVQVASAGTITAGGSGNVTVQGTGGTVTTTTNDGIRVIGANSIITSGGGNVTVTGFGGGISASNTNPGVSITTAGSISAGGSGTVTINGTGGVTSGVNDFGVQVSGANSIITSSGGNVSVTGLGGGIGSSSTSIGVALSTSGKITAGGSGTVTVQGTGGAGTGATNYGVQLQTSGSLITSSGGNVTVTGIGGGSGSSNTNSGIHFLGGAISSGGSGDVVVQGTGGNGTGINNRGIFLSTAGSSISSGGGDITITGIEGNGTTGLGVVTQAPATITSATNGGSISIIANSLAIGCAVTSATNDSIALYPFTDTTTFVGLSTDLKGGPLHLSDQELDSVFTNHLIIGSNSKASVNIASNLTRTASTNIYLRSSDDVIISTGSINTNGGNLKLDPGNSPYGAKPTLSGTDITCSTLSFAGNVSINVNGPTADTEYDQLNVTGSVNLTGASVFFTGTYSPSPGQTFTILLNDDVDAIVGTFNGLAQGGTITNFLNSGLPATISYTGGTGNDVVITVSSPNYTVVTSGNNLVITDVSGNAETANISESGANYRFAVTGRTYSLNGGTIANLPVDVAIAGLNSITINTGVGNDIINHGAFVNTLPSLTINGGTGDDAVNITGDLTFISNANVNLDLQNDDATPGIDLMTLSANANVLLSGTGAATVKVSKNLVMNTGSSIETINGNLTVETNQQVTPATGNFIGIDVNGAILKSTGTGIVTIKGKGGSTFPNQIGIQLRNAGSIMAGSTGTMTIIGTGGNSNNSSNYGVYLNNASSVISTTGANIILTGQSGTGGLVDNNGIVISNGALVSTEGNGNITVTANSALTVGGNNYGIEIFGTSAGIITANGDITVTGTGGGPFNSTGNYGVFVFSSGRIQAGGNGDVFVEGFGGAITSNTNHGVDIFGTNTIVSSTDGDVHIIGHGGGSGAAGACWGFVMTGGGAVKALGAGNVIIEGYSGAGTGLNNTGIIMQNAGTTVSAVTGNISITGQGNGTGSGTSSNGMSITSGIVISTGGSGQINLTGTSSAFSGPGSIGMQLGDTQINTTNGNITIAANSLVTGSSNNNAGLNINSGTVISASGNGSISIAGAGANTSGLNNNGVYIDGTTTRVQTNNGNIVITGTGGGISTSGNGSGVVLFNGAGVTASGSGNVTIHATGGPGTGDFNHGITLTGNTAFVSASAGNISITGIEGNGTLSYGMYFPDPTLITTTGGGNVKLTSNSMTLGQISTLSGDTTFLKPRTLNHIIISNGATDVGPGPLAFSDFELDKIATGTLIIGDALCDSIALNENITRTAITNMQLVSSGDIAFNGGVINTNGGNLYLDPGSSPKIVRPYSSGVDATVNALSFGGNLDIKLNGTTVDVNYTQLNVVGTVNITGVQLMLSGTLVPANGQTFTIVKNDGADPIIGTFTGLPEGTQFPAFFGSNYPAAISYIGGDGNDVVITVLTPNYLITNINGDLDITDLSGNSETLTVSQSGSNINFSVPGRNYSLNGSIVTNLPVDIPLAGIDSISIHAAAGNDIINVSAFTTHLPHLIINGGTGNDNVNMNGDITFLSNTNLDLNLQNDNAVPGEDAISVSPNTDLILSGTGQVIFKSSQNITLSTAAVVQTQNGNLTMEANYQVVPTTNNFTGVYVQNALINVTGTGILTVKGKAGQGNNVQNGVRVESGGDIIGGTTGTAIIEGYGSPSTSSGNYGVQVLNAGSTISSNGANVQVTGFGSGAGASFGNSGVDVNNGGIISAGANGNVTVNGTGGLGSGTNNVGVRVFSSASAITSSGGNVTVNGTGLGSANGSLSSGVSVLGGGKITAGGNGMVNVMGTGGSASGNSNSGVAVSGTSSMITSGGADVHVTGIGGGIGNTSFTNMGVIVSNSGMISASGQGDVYVNGTGGPANSDSNIGVNVSLTGSSITSSDGDILITGQGGGTGASVLGMGISVDGGATVNAGGSGTVTLNGTGANTTGNNNHGVRVRSSGSLVTSAAGNVTVNGIGNGNGASQIGIGVLIELGGKVIAGGQGNVNVMGTGALNTSTSAYGVYVSGANSTVSTSDGNTNITGMGRGATTSSNNVGVWIVNAAVVTAGGMGTVTVTGTGGSTTGTSNHGVVVQQANTLLTSSGGNVNVIGQGGGTGSSLVNRGVLVTFAGKITAGGSGTVNITGTGGIGGGGGNNGVAIENTNSTITSGSGNIFVTGIEGTTSTGISMASLGSISTIISGGNVSLISNSMNLGGNITTNISNSVSLKPYSNGKKIDISSAPDIIGGPLRLTDTELDFISAGSLMIGDVVCDTITVSTNVTRTAATDMQLITGGDIIINGGSINTNLGTLYLQPGNNPKAIKPFQSGNDVNVDTLLVSNQLAILLNGIIPDAQHTQLNVTGKVNVTNASLVLSGSYVPIAGDSFVIVNNDETDFIIGEFDGLNEGDTLFSFFGSALNARVTYFGGTGNDFVIRIINPCVNPDIPVISSTLDTICEGTFITLNITSGNLGGATDWHWYSHGCGTTPVGAGISIQVSPDSTITYYARGEGGCVTTSQCGTKNIIVNPIPDPTIQVTASSDCYFTENIFQPQAPFIPGATYNWTFGNNAVPATATGYGPHSVIYNAAGTKTVKLVIHPNAPGAQCADSSSMTRDIIICTTQIIGRVKSVTNAPISGVNVRLFADANADGIADNAVVIRTSNTNGAGLYAMANVTPGSYVIQQTQPAGWFSFDDGDSSDDGDLAANIDSLDNIIPVTMIPSEVDSMNVFIETAIPGTITGNVFDDQDMDLSPDAGEGLANVLIKLFPDQNANGVADSGTPVATVLTNNDGGFTFSLVPVGHYVITEEQPVDYVSIKDFDASNDNDFVPNSNMLNDTIPLTITNGETDAQNFFAEGVACGLLVTNLNDEGAGSLRSAIGCAEDGDTIRFVNTLSGMTIMITSTILTINKDLVFFSTLTPRIAIQSQINGLFEILPGSEVEFVSLKIVSGLSPGFTGAAFENQGYLILNETNVHRNPSFSSEEYLIRNLQDGQVEFRGNCLLKLD